MGKVSDELIHLIEAQVNKKGIVVWYDPELIYEQVARDLSIPDTSLFYFKDSYFRLRKDIDAFLEFIGDDGRPHHNCGNPPRIVVYIPLERKNTEKALIEIESAGIIMKPGANPWQLNTKLRVIAEHVFKKLAPGNVSELVKKIDEGSYSLEDLDRISLDVKSIGTDTLKLIFDSSSSTEIALQFLASDSFDKEIYARNALSEVEALFNFEFGLMQNAGNNIKDLKKELSRTLFIHELISGTMEEKIPEQLNLVIHNHKQADIQNICSLCSMWRNRADLNESYKKIAEEIEKETGLSDINYSLASIEKKETFPFVHAKLINFAESSILDGNPESAKSIAEKRKSSFWANNIPTYQLHWALLEHCAHIIIKSERVTEEIKKSKFKPEEIVERYTEGSSPWYLLEKHHRHMESIYSRFDIDMEGAHDRLEKVIAFVRQAYTNTLRNMAELFVASLEEKDFIIHNYNNQNEIFSRYITPRLEGEEKTAYVTVDALRYEMGKELVEGLSEDFEPKIIPTIAQLPSLTAIGMAALLPGSEKGMDVIAISDTKIAPRIAEKPMVDRQSRIKHFKESIKDAITVCKLDNIIKPTKKMREEFKSSKLIIVTSREIDRHGEEGSDESETRLYMDEVLDKLRRALRQLASLGVNQFVITADHGYIFGDSLESGMKMEPPGDWQSGNSYLMTQKSAPARDKDE